MFKSIKNNKKTLLISFIFAVLALITLMISSVSNQKKVYEISYRKNSDSNLEISNVIINGDYQDISIYENKDFKYNSKKDKLISTSDEDTKKLAIEVSIIDDIQLNMNSSNGKISIDIKDYNKINHIDIEHKNGFLYYDYGSIKKIVLNYMSKLTIKQYLFWLLLFFAIYIVEFICIKIFSSFLKNLRLQRLNYKNILISIISLFILYLSSIYILLYYLNIFVLIPIISILGYIIYNNRDIIKTKIEYLYIIIAMFAGVSMLFLLPPFHVPDEGAHFAKAYKASYFDEEKIKSDEVGYINIQDGMYDFLYQYSHDVLNSKYMFNSKRYFSNLLSNGNYNAIGKNKFRYSGTMNLPIVPYIPSILIISLGKLIDISPLLMILICKLVNYTITMLLCYAAIKTIPIFKKTFLVVLLFPIFIQQSIAINQDWLTNSIAMLLIANIFYIINKSEKHNYRYLISIVICSIVLSACKFGYFPLLFLIFLIPNDKFKTKKSAILFKLFIFIPILFTFILNSSMGGATLQMDQSDPNKYPISILITRPLEVAHIYIKTFLVRGDIDILEGLVDGFGWSTKWGVGLISYIVVLLYSIFAFSSDDDNNKISMKQRVGLFTIFAMIVGILYSALFFCWTKIGSESIDGLQSRYFIIPVTLLYICISNNLLKINVKNKNLFYGLLLVIVYFFVLYTIISQYYI